MIAQQFIIVATVLVSLLVFSQSTSAIVTSDAMGTHAASPGQPKFGVDLDGVALIGGFLPSDQPTGTCSAALITDRHLISAAHCFDQNGDGTLDRELFGFPSEVLFAIPNGWIQIDYDPNNVQWPDSWPTSRADIAIVTITADAPQEIPRYKLYGDNDEIGQPFVLAGYGYAGFGATGQDLEFDTIPTKRAGLNQYDAVLTDYLDTEFLVFDFDSGQPEHNSLAISGLSSDLGFGLDEVHFAARDSGGPGFLNGAIASVTAFTERLDIADVTAQLDWSWGEGGFNTRVSYHREFILNATDHRAVFVPEPRSPLLSWTPTVAVGLVLARYRSTRRPMRAPGIAPTNHSERKSCPN